VIRVRSNEVNEVFRLGCDSASFFLKIGPNLKREYERLQWLEGRLPAPLPIGLTTQGAVDALLMSAVEGDDLSLLSLSLSEESITSRLSEALKVVHNLSTDNWPFGGNGTVLVHGDACLPNFLYNGNHLSGYIDVGEMTLAEAEVDLAAAVWSLQRNLGPGYGLAFLHTYGLEEADEEEVERLRLLY
jgi:aminoglycoside phosphotransferase